MKKYILTLLCLVALLLCACQPAPVQTPPQTLELTQGSAPVARVIAPEGMTGSLKGAVNTLVSKLKKQTGVQIPVSHHTTELAQGETGIFIGDCDSPEMREILYQLPFADYRIVVRNGNLYIAAHTPELITDAVFAVNKLLSAETIRTTETGAVVLLWHSDIHMASDSYTLQQIRLFETPVQEFTIVYRETEEYMADLAHSLRDWMGQQCGFAPNIGTDDEPAADFEILLGNARQGSQTMDIMQYTIGLQETTLHIQGYGAFSTQQAVEIFKQRLLEHQGAMEKTVSEYASLQEAFAASQGDYRFLQYNILAGLPGYGNGVINEDVDYRKEITASIVLGYDADVVVLNEFYDSWHPTLLPLLKETYSFVQTDRTDGLRNYNLLAYKTDRFTLVDSGYTDIAVASNNHRRAVVWAVLQDKTNGHQILAFATHLDHSGQGSEEQRIRQVGKLKGAIDAVTNRYEGTVVLMGDMNTRVGDTVYETLKTHTGLHNAMEGNGGDIDCCFLNDTVRVVTAFVDNGHFSAYASDHKPIIIDVNRK